MRPILLNSCARAASAAEARFRIDAPIASARASLVIALDAASLGVVTAAARQQDWRTARFYSYDASPAALGGDPEELPLVAVDGGPDREHDQLDEVDVTVMVASDDSGASAASRIGRACSTRGITTAGLVLGVGSGVGQALAALRPYARVLLVPAEPDDLGHLLTALRA